MLLLYNIPHSPRTLHSLLMKWDSNYTKFCLKRDQASAIGEILTYHGVVGTFINQTLIVPCDSETQVESCIEKRAKELRNAVARKEVVEANMIREILPVIESEDRLEAEIQEEIEKKKIDRTLRNVAVYRTRVYEGRYEGEFVVDSVRVCDGNNDALMVGWVVPIDWKAHPRF
jgi:hypothetical protein